MCHFIVYIVYIHRYTSFLTEAALTKAVSTKPNQLRPHLFKAGSSRKRDSSAVRRHLHFFVRAVAALAKKYRCHRTAEESRTKIKYDK